MNRFISNAVGLSAVGALLALGRAGFEIGSAVHAARSITPQASLLIQRLTPGKGKPDALIDAAYNLIHNTNDAVNRPCGDGKPCGVLAQSNKTIVKVGDAVVTTQLLERKTVLEASQTLLGVSQHVDSAADASTGLLQAGTVALNRLPALEDASTEAVGNFNRLVTSPDLFAALGHVQGVTASADGIMLDARKVADKETADWLKPVPWWKAPIAKGGQLIDITAAIARHTP